jgi:tripartite-type tricarboxylate transporter receptor subunit TctC
MRRTLTAVVAAAVAVLAITTPAWAQDWPRRTVRIVVGFGPGGGADIIGRILGQALQERLGQAFVIENKPGSAGVVVQGSTAEAFGAFMASEFKRWNGVREAAGIPQQ